MSAIASSTVEYESVRSPEGIELRFQRAAVSERTVALAIDLGILVTGLVLIGIAGSTVFGSGVALAVSFFLRHFYFVFFETRWNGRTPGKRLFHLRVIRADGGPLTIETLLARNLTREVELFLPMIVVLAPQALFADHHGLVRVLASLWVLLLLFFPLTNRQRLRIGDLLAGTRVVISPPARLLGDLADGSVKQRFAEEAGPGDHRFTNEQLSIYGEHELNVLEDVLRKARGPQDRAALATIAASICKKIGHPPLASREDADPFLRAFYRAQRQRLEHQLLLGKRRLQKDAPPRGRQ